MFQEGEEVPFQPLLPLGQHTARQPPQPAPRPQAPSGRPRRPRPPWPSKPSTRMEDERVSEMWSKRPHPSPVLCFEVLECLAVEGCLLFIDVLFELD